MDIMKLLEEAIWQNFKADNTIKALTKEICAKAKEYVLEKYKSKKIFRHGMEFELYTVNARIYYNSGIEIPKVDITLIYIVSEETKLSIAKKENIASAKKSFDEGVNYVYTRGKPNLWETLHYEIEMEKVLSDNINLQIDYA